MKTQTWLILIVIGCLLSPAAGMSVIGLYLFNYATAIIFDIFRSREFK